MSRVIIVRHGESRWNAEHRYQGQQDSGLTPRGREQAAQVARLLAATVPSPLAIWSSDLPRAYDTAVAFATVADLEIRSDPRLREVDIGSWSGRTLAEVAEQEPELVAAAAAGVDVRRGGGETFAEVRHRVVAWLTEACAEHSTVVAFSHGGAIRVAAAHAAGTPTPGHTAMAPPTNCSRTELIVDHTRTRLSCYNLPLPEM